MIAQLNKKYILAYIMCISLNLGYEWITLTPSMSDLPLIDDSMDLEKKIVLPDKSSGNLFTPARARLEDSASLIENEPDSLKSLDKLNNIRLVAIREHGLRRYAIFQGTEQISVQEGEILTGIGKVTRIWRRQVQVQQNELVRIFEIFPIPEQNQ